MGLCKCPKKKVTNLFCFEHRVNVCEHCLVANHNRCVVQSYLQWLQDSDFNPNCSLCSKSLTDDACGQCVRLTCYDVFHFVCLNQYALQLPANTAPAGYTCPTCRSEIFPKPNQVGPVAENVRDILSKVNWARAGLGLPLIEEKEAVQVPQVAPTQQAQQASAPAPNGDIKLTPRPPEPSTNLPTPTLTNLTTLGASPAPKSSHSVPHPSTPYSQSVLGTKPVHNVINVDAGTTARSQDPRKLFDSTKEDMLNLSHDHDDDKYKRRPAMDWLNRWLRSRDTGGKRGMKKEPTSVRKRFLIVLMIGIIGFLTLIVIFSKLGRQASEDDPFLDPMANPNIRVNDGARENQ